MHKLAEKIADCMKAKVEAKGIDNIEGQDLAELGMWTDIIKDLVCYDKDKKIIEAMDEAEESEEAMKYIEMYEDYPERKGYRGQMRDSKGRYMSRRKGYMPMMYDYDWDNMQMDRDMDREHGKMYYTEPMTMRNDNQTHSESRYDRARKGYEESKAMHKGNTAEDKQHKMKELENYMKELSTDVTDMISEMSPEEKSLMKQKMSVLMQKIG